MRRFILREIGSLDKNVIILGIVSFFNDIASEMVFSLLPVFMSNVLLLDKHVIGLIEGMAESSSSLFKIISGRLAMKAKRQFIGLGYVISTLCKPLFALANSWWLLFLVRFADRAGKGIRTPPRDALIADLTKREMRGKAFGLHRAMDTLGALFGPLFAFFLVGAFSLSYYEVFLLAVLPAGIAVAVFYFFVEDKETQKKIEVESGGGYDPLIEKHNSRLFLLATSLFAIGNFSFAFVLIRANEIGVDAQYVPLVYLLFNACYVLFSIPFGAFADKVGSRKALQLSYAIFGITFFGFGFTHSVSEFIVILCLYGAAFAGVETLQRVVGSKVVESKMRVTLFGNYQGMGGFLAFFASFFAGLLWETYGPQSAFFFGGASSIVAAIILFRMKSIMVRYKKDSV
ncbi:MAG: MFS transporter [Candidatus Anstonellales archaeon]